MAKAPRQGEVKTRLIPPLTAAEAAALSVAFIRDTAENILAAARKRGDRRVCRLLAAGFGGAVCRICRSGSGCCRRAGSGSARACSTPPSDLLAAGYGAACLVDADSPTLPTAFLVEAAQALAMPGDRVVLGGAEDGGYYLIGLKQPHRRLFEDIAWSSEIVFRQTIDRAAEIGLDVHILPVWYDVDDIASLRRLSRDLAAADRAGCTGPAHRGAAAASPLLVRRRQFLGLYAAASCCSP